MNTHLSKLFTVALLSSAAIFTSIPAFSQDNEKPNALLEVSVNGVIHKGEAEFNADGIHDEATARQYLEQNSIRVPKDGEVQLKVELITKDGIRRDVTADPHLAYLNVEKWVAQVSRTGLITRKPDPRFTEPNLLNSTSGQIMFVYKDGNIFGYNNLLLQVNRQ